MFAPLANDVFGSPLDKLLIIAVLTSASASTQTTILPTARTSLSMARDKALPEDVRRGPPALPDAATFDDLDGRRLDRLVRRARRDVSREHPRRRDHRAGAEIAFYYGLTGFACTDLLPQAAVQSAKNFLFLGVRCRCSAG